MKTFTQAAPPAPDLTIHPGGLIRLGEEYSFGTMGSGTLTIARRVPGGFEEVDRSTLDGKSAWKWKPDFCGSYLAVFTSGGERFQRPLGVVDSGWAVCQITVGAFTAEDFAEIIHGGCVAADYYVNIPRPGRSKDFTAADERWKNYERFYGDAIHPHVMAADVGTIDPAYAHHNPNWDTLSEETISRQLRRLRAWWEAQGYRPLDRIASYTPCNALVGACSRAGIRILHSLIPEQNWSDGEWVINHWGMPTCPFWISDEEFRKPGGKAETGVLGMTMNHYHVVLPHMTKWGDFVLSPSHFDRWLRAADAGPEPVRFRQFLGDTVRGWSSADGHPFFFVAGFEFGRTFGTRKMTAYNAKGLRSLIELAGSQPLVFATSGDVLAYYERHVDRIAGRLFRQRDSWAGVTVNGKPAMAGDSVIVERNGYKAAMIEGRDWPFFYYDYQVAWKYGSGDADVPEDFAEACRDALEISREIPGRLSLRAEKPLERTIPVVVWGCEPAGEVPFPYTALPRLDDGRHVGVLEIPPGWSGAVSIPFKSLEPAVPHVRIEGDWKIQTFGDPGEECHYVVLDLPLTGEVVETIWLKRPAWIDGARGPLGKFEAGEVKLVYGPLKGWYRIRGCGGADIVLPAKSFQKRPLLADGWPAEVEAHAKKLHEAAMAVAGENSGRLALTTLCGGSLPLGTRSRAEAWDRISSGEAGVMAREFGDGVIAFGPGRSFWYHPRNLHIKIFTGDLFRAGSRPHVLLNSFDPLGLDAEYNVLCGGRKIGPWKLPSTAFEGTSWFPLEIFPEDRDESGNINIGLATSQTQVLENWWDEGGFMAALHALWIFR